jgi:arylsulfatase A-like enzyme
MSQGAYSLKASRSSTSTEPACAGARSVAAAKRADLQKGSRVRGCIALMLAAVAGACAPVGEIGRPEAALPGTVLSRMWEPSVLRLEETETRHLDFSSAADHRALGEGWDDRLIHDGQWIWSTSIDSEVVFEVLRPRDRILAFVAGQHHAPPFGPQSITVVWNTTPLGVCRFSEKDGWTPRTFQFVVPEKAQVKGRNTLRFLSRFAVSQRSFSADGTGDPRRRSFRLSTVHFVDDEAELSVGAAVAARRSTFGDGTISQPPATLLRFPFQVPAGRTFFTLDAPPGAVIRVAWDYGAGPRERVIRARGVDAASRPLQVDLSPIAGQYAELIFDTSEADWAGEDVVWLRPILWNDGSDTTGARADVPAAPDFSGVRNVVLVLLDAMRADAPGFGGNPRKPSPFLDSLAASGLRFARAYAQGSYTYTSTASLLTSRNAIQHGVRGYPQRLAESVVTTPQHLSQSGIYTGCIAENPNVGTDLGVDRYFDFYQAAVPDFEGGSRTTPRERAATLAALEFLERHKDRPFFLYLHYVPPHSPYSAHNPHASSYTIDPAPGIPPDPEPMKEVNRGERPAPREAVLQLRARYDENMRMADEIVRELCAGMAQLGYGPETVLIISADHGEDLGEHGRFGHGTTVYETALRIPLLVVRGPQPSGPAVLRHDPVRSIDILPTVCALLGIDPPEGISGKSVLAPPAATSDTSIVAHALSDHPLPLEAFVTPRYKLIRDSGSCVTEVYDLLLDPGEKVNLATRSPALTHRLLAEAEAWRARQEASAVLPTSGEGAMDSEKAKQLEALGYVQ